MSKIKMILIAIAITGIHISLTGCSINRATAEVTPGVNLAKIDSFYVVKSAADSRGINDIIVRQMTEKGLSASTGNEPSPPDSIITKVTYLDRWMWDITMYMIELTITVSDAKTDFTLASGNSYHTSLSRKSPEKMVEEVLANIFSGDKE